MSEEHINIQEHECLGHVERVEATDAEIVAITDFVRVERTGLVIRTDIRSANYGPNTMNTPSGIMLHHTAGTESSDLPTLTRRGTGVSSNDYINKQGIVFELVPFPRRAWAAGTRDASQAGKYYVDGNTNYWSMEIENLGNGSDPYPKAQIDAVVARCRERAAKWGIKHLAQIFRHRDFAPSRKTDTSNNFPFEEVRRRILASSDDGGGAQPPAPPSGSRPQKPELVHMLYKANSPAQKVSIAAVEALEANGFPKDHIGHTGDPDEIRYASFRSRHGKLGQYISILNGTSVLQYLHPEATKALKDDDGEYYPPDVSDMWKATGEGAGTRVSQMRWRIAELCKRQGTDAAKTLDTFEKLLK